MVTQQSKYESSAAAPDTPRARIMRLFETSEGGALAERDFDARVSEMVRSFLETSGVNTDVELESLRELFRHSALPARPADVGSYTESLAANVVAHSIRTSSPRFIGHMTSALPYFVQPLAKLMVALNQNTVKVETSKALHHCERQVVAIMHQEVFGRPDDYYRGHAQRGASTLGVLTSGGTVANLTALWCARNASLGPDGDFAGVEVEGLPAALEHYGRRGVVVIGSSLMHYSFLKAAGILGIGTRGLVKVPVDADHRVDLDALRAAVEDCRRRNLHVLAVIGVAGTTDSGAVDPLVEVGEIAREAKAHFHVDAAWGGSVLFSDANRHLLRGIDAADSVTIDGHKQLYLPMGIGMALFCDPHLARAIEKQASYIVRASAVDLGKRSLEGSRPGVALFLHAALNIIGREGYGFLVEEGMRKARYMADAVRARQPFELLVYPQTNILNYRYVAPELRERAAQGDLTVDENRRLNQLNVSLQRAQRRAGSSFVSRTVLESTRYGRGVPVVALRAVLANPLTTERDIDTVLDEQVRIAEASAPGPDPNATEGL
jgi:glutamate decarboxylase